MTRPYDGGSKGCSAALGWGAWTRSGRVASRGLPFPFGGAGAAVHCVVAHRVTAKEPGRREVWRAYWSRMTRRWSGAGSATICRGHTGRAPVKAQAAWTAAPSATYSPGPGPRLGHRRPARPLLLSLIHI